MLDRLASRLRNTIRYRNRACCLNHQGEYKIRALPRTVSYRVFPLLKVHKIENFFDSDFGICVISLLVMSKY